MSHLILEFSNHFCPFEIDLSCLVTLFDCKHKVFKTCQNWPFLAFFMTFCPLKCKRSSLRSQCWMRLFLWFSNTVMMSNVSIHIVYLLTFWSNFVQIKSTSIALSSWYFRSCLQNLLHILVCSINDKNGCWICQNQWR